MPKEIKSLDLDHKSRVAQARMAGLKICAQCGIAFKPLLPSQCCSMACTEEYYKDCPSLPPPSGCKL